MNAADALQGARVLVTGGHGFIGRPLSMRLGKAGAQVVALSRTPHPDSEYFRSEAVDLCDEAAVNALFSRFRPDIVLHLASYVVGKRTEEVVLSTFHNNLTSTVHLLLAAQRTGCRRVVLTGSLSRRSV